MKVYIAAALTGVLLMSSCKNFGEQEAKSDLQEETQTETETTRDTLPNEEIQYADTSLSTEELRKNTSLEEILGTTLEEWQNRKTVRLSMDDLENTSEEDIPAVTLSLKEELQQMRNDVPVDERTKKIQNQFDAVSAELDELQEILEEDGVDENKIKMQSKQVVMAYNDLEVELGIPVAPVENLQ